MATEKNQKIANRCSRLVGKRGEGWQKGAETAVACILHSRVSCNTAVYTHRELKDIFGNSIDSSSLAHGLVQISAELYQ